MTGQLMIVIYSGRCNMERMYVGVEYAEVAEVSNSKLNIMVCHYVKLTLVIVSHH